MSEKELNAALHIILVEPAESLNIGSVARAMSNFGMKNLHLVTPRGYDRDRARITACWGDPLLDMVRIWDSLDEAIAEMHEVIGFSPRTGKNLPLHKTLGEFRCELEKKPTGNVALLFGPEDKGLSNEHLERCRLMVRIPSALENPSLNLAQAVVVALYELTRNEKFGELPVESPRATATQYRALDMLLDDVLTRSDFINSSTPADIPGLVHSIFRRTQASEREMQILLGMLNKITQKLSGKF